MEIVWPIARLTKGCSGIFLSLSDFFNAVGGELSDKILLSALLFAC